MRSLMLVPVAFLLAGCTTTGTSDLDGKMANAFAVACAAEPTAHQVFLTFAPGRVSQRIVDQEANAHAVAVQICATPPTNVGEAVARVTAALAVVYANARLARQVAAQ